MPKNELIKKTVSEQEDKIMTWDKFLNDLLTKEQILVLREALRVNAKVYFYGKGLGKSVIAEVLQSFGYRASEPGMRLVSCQCDVPIDKGYICFEVKNKTPKTLNIYLRKQLRSQKESFMKWVQGEQQFKKGSSGMDLSIVSTLQLIEELKKRKGVESGKVESNSPTFTQNYTLARTYSNERDINADIVLVVRDLNQL